ncbi:hypothetical protein TNCV_1772681 [Trichonephila clavipes]|nr:hypothetical protein TNCV_1772681 [Trichonephila clavipes]
MWIFIIIRKNAAGVNSTLKHHIGSKDISLIALWVDSTCIKDIEWCTTAQHFSALDKDFFASKFDFCYVGGMKVIFTFSPDNDLTGITLPGESRLITAPIV